MIDERFWAKVDKSGDCWLWRGGGGNGYGRVGRVIDGKRKWFGAHQFSYIIHNGPIPVGLYVRHLCHTGLCVNPAHLIVGTAAENCADTARSGRARNQWTGKLKPMEPIPVEAMRWCAGGEP